MTLLAYMSNSDNPPAQCAPLDELMNDLAVRFPHSFFVPVTSVPPRTTRPWAQQDWLTLPLNMAASKRANLLRTAAQWFQATVVLFLGADAKAEFEAFDAHSGCRKLLWDGVAWQGDGIQTFDAGFLDALLGVLRTSLPVLCTTKQLQTEAIEQSFATTRSEDCPLWVYAHSPLGAGQVSALATLAQRHPRSVHLRVSLRKGLSSVAGVKALRGLLAANPPLRFTVVAENDWFASAAVAMTKLLATKAGANVRAVTAPKPGVNLS